MISDILQIVISLVLAAIVYKVAFRRGALSTIDTAQQAVNLMETAINDMAESQEELNAANEEMSLMHAQNVGLVLEALDHHVKETGKTLHPDHAHTINQIRPYYTAQTIH